VDAAPGLPVVGAIRIPTSPVAASIPVPAPIMAVVPVVPMLVVLVPVLALVVLALPFFDLNEVGCGGLLKLWAWR